MGDFDRALKLEPKNPEVTKEIALVKRKIAAQEQKDKKRFRNMFNKLHEEEENKGE